MNYKINLLPDELRKDKSLDTKALVTKGIIYGILGLLVIGEIFYGSMLAKVKYQTAQVETEINQMQQQVVQVQNLTASNNKLKAKIAAFEKLAPKSSWADLLEHISTFMSENIWLTQMYIDDKNTLIIEGNADKLSNLGDFMAGLRSIKGFTTVNLISSASNLNGIKFTISVGRGE